jgi:hypothetical protein
MLRGRRPEEKFDDPEASDVSVAIPTQAAAADPTIVEAN